MLSLKHHWKKEERRERSHMHEAQNGSQPVVPKTTTPPRYHQHVETPNQEKRSGKVSSRLLHHQTKKANLSNPYSLSIEQAIMAEKEAISTLCKSKLTAAKWRKDHNGTLESVLAKANGIAKHKCLNLNRIETQCLQS